jgi:hypothetical protein
MSGPQVLLLQQAPFDGPHNKFFIKVIKSRIELGENWGAFYMMERKSLPVQAIIRHVFRRKEGNTFFFSSPLPLL